MNPNDLALIKSSFILMLAGMGMTFIFLLVQAFCTNVNSRICEKFKHLVPEPELKKPAPKKSAASTEDDSAIVAAIAAAIHHASR